MRQKSLTASKKLQIFLKSLEWLYIKQLEEMADAEAARLKGSER